MQVWNVLQAAHWKYRKQKSPFWHHRTTLLGYVFGTTACINNRKKNLLNSNTSSTCPDNMVKQPTNGWGLLASLGHPCKFQWVSLLGSRTARDSSSGRQPHFAALNRAYHLYSAGWPSRWALAHISSFLLCWSVLVVTSNSYWTLAQQYTIFVLHRFVMSS